MTMWSLLCSCAEPVGRLPRLSQQVNFEENAAEIVCDARHHASVSPVARERHIIRVSLAPSTSDLDRSTPRVGAHQGESGRVSLTLRQTEFGFDGSPSEVSRSSLDYKPILDGGYTPIERVVEFDCTDERVFNFTTSREEDICNGASFVVEEEEKLDANCEDKFTFDLGNGKLGLEVALYRDFLMVWKLKDDPDGLVRQYNDTKASSQAFGAISCGDQILEVDSETNPGKMLKLVKAAREERRQLSMTIRKRKRNFDVTIRGLPNPKLGVKCVASGHQVFIRNIAKGIISMIALHQPRHSICIGDEIQACNGVPGEAILDQLRKWANDPSSDLILSIVAGE